MVIHPRFGSSRRSHCLHHRSTGKHKSHEVQTSLFAPVEGNVLPLPEYHVRMRKMDKIGRMSRNSTSPREPSMPTFTARVVLPTLFVLAAWCPIGSAQVDPATLDTAKIQDRVGKYLASERGQLRVRLL